MILSDHHSDTLSRELNRRWVTSVMIIESSLLIYVSHKFIRIKQFKLLITIAIYKSMYYVIENDCASYKSM